MHGSLVVKCYVFIASYLLNNPRPPLSQLNNAPVFLRATHKPVFISRASFGKAVTLVFPLLQRSDRARTTNTIT